MDVAVVGAGPAGTWAAERLARGGARVTIFDASHPREKPCGGGVTGRALALVADAVDIASVPATAIRSARFIDRTGASATVALDVVTTGGPRPPVVTSGGPRPAVVTSGTPCPPDAALIVASRAAFDAAMLAAAVRAGAFHERTRVRDVAIDADGVRLDTVAGPRPAAFIVGADGANSLVRRRVARAFRRDQLSTATGVFARGVTGSEIVLQFDADPPGYFWSFPRPDHLAIGVCAPTDAGVAAAALRERAVAWTAKAH